MVVQVVLTHPGVGSSPTRLSILSQHDGPCTALIRRGLLVRVQSKVPTVICRDSAALGCEPRTGYVQIVDR
jgi:hypothetical protein